MNIVMIHPHDVQTSPWTIRIIKLAEKMRDKGHTVNLLYFIEPQRRKLGYRTSQDDHFSLSMEALHKYRLCRNVRRLRFLCLSADVVHIQKCFAHVTIPTLFAAYVTGKPVHYDWDDWEEGITADYLGSHPFTDLVAYYEKRLPGLVDSISVASEALKGKALDLGFAEDRIVTIPVGADPTFFSPNTPPDKYLELPSGDGPVVLYAGQIEGANYASLFIRAAAQVLKKLPYTRFVVVGGGFGLVALKKMAAALDLTHKLVFTDYVFHKRMPGILAHADVCVATFDDNPIARCKSPLKIVEYMSMARPIVSSAVGEVKNMLQSCGVLVEPGEPEAVSSALIDLLSDEQRRKELGVAARRAVEAVYNWRAGAETLLSAYSKLTDQGEKHAGCGPQR